MSSFYTLYVYNNTYTLSTSNGLNNSMPLYDKNIILHCGVDNKTNFKFVTDNNVPKDLTNLTAYFNVTDIENNETVIAKTMTVTNATRGEANIEVNASELYEIAPGFYNFTAYLQNSSQVQTLAYTDRAGDMQGTLEIKDSGLPKARETQTASTFTQAGSYFYSSNLKGSSERNLTARNHTIAVYTTGYTGDFEVQGNLDTTPSVNNDDWFTVDVQGQGTNAISFTTETGVNPFFFVTSAPHLRIRFTKSAGSVDKVLLRN